METMSNMIKNWIGEWSGKVSRVPLAVSSLNPQPSTLNPQRGFTIVEMMMVVAVIAILAGIITMGVGSMFRSARAKRADAMARVLQSGLETYYARTGAWPPGINQHLNDRGDSVELDNDTGKPDHTHGKSEETDKAFQEIVKMSVLSSGSPLLDPSGLFVAESGKEYCCDNHHHQDKSKDYGFSHGKCPRGRDFSEAVKNTKDRKKLNIANMTFGYQGPNNGHFCRYRIIFHPKTDSVEVRCQPATEAGFSDD